MITNLLLPRFATVAAPVCALNLEKTQSCLTYVGTEGFLNQCPNTRQTSTRKLIYFFRTIARLNRDSPRKQTDTPGTLRTTGAVNDSSVQW